MGKPRIGGIHSNLTVITAQHSAQRPDFIRSIAKKEKSNTPAKPTHVRYGTINQPASLEALKHAIVVATG